MNGVVFVYMTARDYAEASAIGKILVEERLAACCNILEGMRSIYRWDGRICEESETVLIAKTRQTSVHSLTRRVKELHSYDCPCIAVIPVTGGNEDYLAWIVRETSGG